MTCNEEFCIIPISFKEKLLGFMCAAQYLTPHLLYHLNIAQNYSACCHLWMFWIKNNILEPSVPLMLPTQGKIDVLVRGDSGFECFRYVFQHFIVLFDRLIAFLFATCTLCCIRPCISKRHMLEGLMNYSFPNNTALTPIRFQRGEVWYLFCKHCFLPFLSLASWFSWVKLRKQRLQQQ